MKTEKLSIQNKFILKNQQIENIFYIYNINQNGLSFDKGTI